jgi:hypothetical protein
LLQAVEAKKLIGSMMSIVTEAGEEWVYLTFYSEQGVFELTDDATETKLILSRGLAMSLVALLRVALAQFSILREAPEPRGDTVRETGIEPRVQVSRDIALVAWPSGGPGVQRRDTNGQVELRLSAAVGVAIEEALVTGLANLAAGKALSPRAQP